MFECQHQPLVVPPSVAADLAARYSEPHRAYHTLSHIAAMLAWFDSLAWTDPASVYLAILFHDAIYDPLAKDNEARSADLARSLVSASPRVCDLILLTSRHGSLSPADVSDDLDAAHFLDVDTSILGASPAAFDAYDAGVAFEYSVVPPAAYLAGRRAFLSNLLSRPRIFLSSHFHALLDAPARANLRRALARLSTSATS
ncbi:MAG TPA: hypothetical protein VGM88_16330 [Kofleriaceae bacterium]